MPLVLTYACMALTLFIGVTLSIALHRKFGGLGLGMFGLFMLVVDSDLHWPQVVLSAALAKLGWWVPAVYGTAWAVTWKILPLLYAGACAWVIWGDARKVSVTRPAAGDRVST